MVPRAALREAVEPGANGLGMYLRLDRDHEELTGKQTSDRRGPADGAWTVSDVTWGSFPEDQNAVLLPWGIALRPQNYGGTPGRSYVFFPNSLVERDSDSETSTVIQNTCSSISLPLRYREGEETQPVGLRPGGQRSG